MLFRSVMVSNAHVDYSHIERVHLRTKLNSTSGATYVFIDQVLTDLLASHTHVLHISELLQFYLQSTFDRCHHNSLSYYHDYLSNRQIICNERKRLIEITTK